MMYLDLWRLVCSIFGVLRYCISIGLSHTWPHCVLCVMELVVRTMRYGLNAELVSCHDGSCFLSAFFMARLASECICRDLRMSA
ncbi:hypothetical protein BDV25DRAFT_42329 [Aspergillus avenaceus]|uniref:Uncharacterized protein n=1 Tax=Aspergillus avenaceus TaxID=36643 RepID=A0A5N6U3W7_ASPAV|nr:hypothetical protein BDV25DRAFT_42329 [Aspergillus avenaceus]